MTTLFLVVVAVSVMVGITSRSATTLTGYDPAHGGVSSPGGGRASAGTVRRADPFLRARMAAMGRPTRRGIPIWRRVIELAILIAIWIGIGLAIAAIVGGAVAGAALLLQELLT